MTYEETKAAQSFVPPSSWDEAERRRIELISVLEDMALQLSARTKTTPKLNPDGTKMSFNEYVVWRHRCLDAKRHIEAELRYLKLWMKQNRPDTKKMSGHRTDLLAEAHRILVRLQDHLLSEEKATLEKIEALLTWIKQSI